MIRTTLALAALAGSLLTTGAAGTAYAAPAPLTQCRGAQVGAEEELIDNETRLNMGLHGWADTAFGVLPEGDGNYRFLAVDALPGEGEAAQNIAVTSGTLADPLAGGVEQSAPVIGIPEGFQYGGGGPIFEDPWSDTVLQMLHLEQSTPGGFYSTLHLGLYDRESGRTTYLGPLAAPTATHEQVLEHENMSADMGTPSIVLRDGYFYVFFPDYYFDQDGGYRSTALSVARATFDDVMNAAYAGEMAPWKKYYQGTWGSDAVGGPSTDIRPGERGSWHPNTVRTERGGSLLVQGVSASEIVLSDSADGVLGWSAAVPLFDDPGKFDIYPTVVGTGADPSVVGDEFYVYYVQWSGVEPYWDDARIMRRLVSCTGN